MDETRFDALAKTLNAAHGRRGVLHLLASTALGWLLGAGWGRPAGVRAVEPPIGVRPGPVSGQQLPPLCTKACEADFASSASRALQLCVNASACFAKAGIDSPRTTQCNQLQSEAFRTAGAAVGLLTTCIHGCGWSATNYQPADAINRIVAKYLPKTGCPVA